MNKLKLVFLMLMIVNPVFALTLDKIPDSRLDVTAFCCDSSETRLFVGLLNASLWKSDDGGQSWESLNSRICPSGLLFGVQELFALDINADTVFCKTWNGSSNPIYQYVYTVDGGDNWDILDTDSNIGIGHQLIVDRIDHSRLLHIDGSQISLSEDFGESWESWIYDPRRSQKSALIQHPDSSNVLYTVGYGISGENVGGVYRSEDFGRTWESVFNAADFAVMDLIYVVDIDILSNGSIVISLSHGSSESEHSVSIDYIISNNNENGNWELLDVGLPQGFHSTKLIESISNEGTLFIIGFPADFQLGHGIFRSTDYGNSFHRIDEGLPQDFRNTYNICQNVFNETFYILTQGRGIIKSLDGGTTWIEMDLNMHLGNPFEFSLHDGSVFSRSYQSTDRVVEYDILNGIFQNIGYPHVTGDTSLCINENIIVDQDNIFALFHKYSFDQEYSSTQVFGSGNYGQDWYNVGEQLVFPEYVMFHQDNIHNTSDLLRIVNVADFNGTTVINTSIDTSRTWNTTIFDVQYVNYNRMVAQTNDHLFLAVSNEGIFESVDDGLTWNNLNFPNISYLENRFVYLIANQTNNNLYVFDNFRTMLWDGETWTDCGTSLCVAGNLFDICLLDNENPSFIATHWGYNLLWYRSSLTSPWESIEVVADFLDESRNLLYVKYDETRDRIWVSNQLGLYYFDRNQLEVKDKPIQLHPVGYEVLTAYPNPFNASTRIEFILEQQSDVSLKLYDINGRLVRELLNEESEAGKHNLTFDGSQLASGTYFIKLENGDQITSRKLVLLK